MARNARNKTPRYYYNQQKQNAKYRGIEWLFDFDSWWKVWEDSGKYSERGTASNQYCMSRKGDTGPYSPENVVIRLSGQNASEGLQNWPAKKAAREELALREKISEEKPIEEDFVGRLTREAVARREAYVARLKAEEAQRQADTIAAGRRAHRAKVKPTSAPAPKTFSEFLIFKILDYLGIGSWRGERAR